MISAYSERYPKQVILKVSDSKEQHNNFPSGDTVSGFSLVEHFTVVGHNSLSPNPCLRENNPHTHIAGAVSRIKGSARSGGNNTWAVTRACFRAAREF